MIKRVKIDWDEVGENPPFIIAAIILGFTPIGVAMGFDSGWPFLLYPIAAIWLIWNELGDDNEET